MLFYTFNEHYSKQHRKYLNNLLRPIIPINKFEKLNIDSNLMKMINNIEDADLCILPMDWNYYLDYRKTTLAIQAINTSRKYNKKIIIGIGGDRFVNLPQYDNIIGIYLSAYKSKLHSLAISLPVIVRDPLFILGLNVISIRQYNKIPLIGFCGHQDSYLFISFIKMIKLIWKNGLYKLSLSKYYWGPITPATYIRKMILNILEKSSLVKTKFIRRIKYQGGISKNDKVFESLNREFYNNILDTDYTLCVRGSGNFSARFYETLALGRIPIFIDTDCILPFNNQIDWISNILIVKHDDLENLDKRIISFHNSLNEKSFKNIQNENRKIWEKYFQYSNFFKEHVSLIKNFVKNEN